MRESKRYTVYTYAQKTKVEISQPGMKKRHAFLNTVILCCILAGGAVTFWFASGDKKMQLATGVVTTVAYVAWGIIHHAMDKTLHRNVVVEYMLIGAIAIVLLLTLAL